MSESLIQMQRKLADVTSKLENAEGEIAEAQATLAKLREQKPVAWECGSYMTKDPKRANWYEQHTGEGAIAFYHSAVPAPAVPEEWREVMTELADDLAIEIDQSYPPERRAYPSEQRRYEMEMEIVNRARALLQSEGCSSQTQNEVRHD